MSQFTGYLMALSNKLSVLKAISKEKKRLDQCTIIHLKCSEFVDKTCNFESDSVNGRLAIKSMLNHIRKNHKSVEMYTKMKTDLIATMDSIIKTVKLHSHK